MRFRTAVVRPPTDNFAHGLTKSTLGKPDAALALEQHARYCEALARCGLNLVRLPAAADYPDATFVEDTAILTGKGAIVMRPGAASRRGEVASVRAALAGIMPILGEIASPAVVDGGDVCEAGGRFFIGLSDRTDEAGAGQLLAILKAHGYDGATIDVRGAGMLHLKSGLAALDERRVVAVPALAGHRELAAFDVVPVASDEAYAANCIAVNGRVLIASGFPRLEGALKALGYEVVTLDMSELEKMDGGLSCLSLRF